MATLPTDDEKVRMVLDIFKHFGSRPGHALGAKNFTAVGAKAGLNMSDIADGIRVGGERGLFEDGPNNSVKLTDAGFAEM
jgi:hypothetical protein